MKQWVKDIYIAFKYKIPMDSLIVDSVGNIYEISKRPTDWSAKIRYDDLKLPSDIPIKKWINSK